MNTTMAIALGAAAGLISYAAVNSTGGQRMSKLGAGISTAAGAASAYGLSLVVAKLFPEEEKQTTEIAQGSE